MKGLVSQELVTRSDSMLVGHNVFIGYAIQL